MSPRRTSSAPSCVRCSRSWMRPRRPVPSRPRKPDELGLMSSEALLAALAGVQDPEIRRPITELDMVRSATVADGVASIELKLTIVGCPAADRIEADVRAAAGAVEGVERVELDIGVMTVAERET